MGDSVGLHESGLGDIPVVSSDGDLVSKQAAWFGGTATFEASVGTSLGQYAINCSGTD